MSKRPEVEVNVAWWVAEALRDFKTKAHFVTGGLGSGKTHGAVQWHYDLVTENPKARYSWFLEPVHARVKDTAIPKWLDFFQLIGLRETVHWDIYQGNPTVFKLCSGQEIHLLSAHNPDLLVGAEISHFTIDEPGKTKYDAFLKCMSRMRDPLAWRRQGMLSGSPEGDNWFKDLGDFQGIDVQRLYRRFQLFTSENPYNAPDYVQQLMITWEAFPARLKAYLYGVFTSFFEGMCITEFDEATDLDAGLTPDPDQDLYLTFDFNAYPLAFVVAQIQKFPYLLDNGVIHNVRNYVVLAESHGKNEGNLEDAATEFKKKFPTRVFRHTPIKIYGDRTGHAKSHKVRHTDFQQLENYLKEEYMHVEVCAQRQVAPQTDSIEEVNRLFSYQLVKVHPRCTNFVNSIKTTRWKDGTREIYKPAGDKHTHWLDAFKYLAYQLKDLDILNAKRSIVTGINY